MSSANGDYVVTESRISDVNHDDFDDMNTEPGTPVMKKQSNNGRKEREKRDFPPPIPLLAHRTHNLSSHMMPWELKRYYTGDGSLILREETPRHHHFFRAHRANGRLTLQLVPLNHVFPTDSLCLSAHHRDSREQHVEEVEAASPSQVSGAVDDGFGDEGPNTMEAEGLPRTTNCNLNFKRVSPATSCFFEMPAVHPIRTVHG